MVKVSPMSYKKGFWEGSRDSTIEIGDSHNGTHVWIPETGSNFDKLPVL